MSIAASKFQPLPLESRIRRLGRRFAFWWRRETTAADVSSAFHTMAKAHERYSSNADSAHRAIREWSSQLGSPAFAPELDNFPLENFMLEICTAVKPDATQTQALNEILSGVAHTFYSLISDETNCKKYVHELMTARKNVDKCRSNSLDSGLLEKSCEHWEERLLEAVRAFRTKSSTQLRADINLLLNHLRAVEPSIHDSKETIDRAYKTFANASGMMETPKGSDASPRSHLDTSYNHKCEDVGASSSPLYNMSYQSRVEVPQQDQTSAYSRNSFESQIDEGIRWNGETSDNLSDSDVNRD